MTRHRPRPATLADVYQQLRITYALLGAVLARRQQQEKELTGWARQAVVNALKKLEERK